MMWFRPRQVICIAQHLDATLQTRHNVLHQHLQRNKQNPVQNICSKDNKMYLICSALWIRRIIHVYISLSMPRIVTSQRRRYVGVGCRWTTAGWSMDLSSCKRVPTPSLMRRCCLTPMHISPLSANYHSFIVIVCLPL